MSSEHENNHYDDSSVCGFCGLDEEFKEEEFKEDEYITIISSDNDEFKILKKHITLSKFLTNAICDDTDNEIILSYINSEYLDLIVKYLEYHNGIEPPKIVKSLDNKILNKTNICDFDNTFINNIGSDKYKLKEFANYALYMDINSLLDLIYFKMGDIISNSNAVENWNFFTNT